MQSIKIAPSILSADFSCLKDEIQAVEAAGADWLHVDVMDGHFVPNITIGPVVVEWVRKVTAIPVDVHLMITDPDKYAPEFIKAGKVERCFSDVDMILMMTVFPGFGGQAFISDVLPKIEQVRKLIDQRKLAVLVEADGGIKADNIARVVRAGAEVIVSGSGIFKTPDYAETIRQMRQAIGQL